MVRAALDFLSNLTASEYFSNLSNPMVGVTRQVPFLVVGFSMGLLCVNMLLSLLYKGGVISLCSKRRESFKLMIIVRLK